MLCYPRVPWISSKNFNQFGPAVWPVIANIYILSWEPSAANVTKSYSRRLPALERFYWETKFSLNLESQNQAKNIPVGLPSSPIKI